MLNSLTVENYALIEHLEVDFDSGLNIITGETGAGKSILMGALGLLLGNKADSSAIKDASRNCIVEAEFNVEGLPIRGLMEENEIDYEPQTIIRRIITPSGKSRAFVNDTPVPLATLKAIGEYLIDIHSQHQNLILSSPSFRTEALDAVAECSEIKSEYQSTFARLGRARKALQEAEAAANKSHDDEDWLRHQAEELTAAALREGECEELEEELRTLENADSICERLSGLHDALDNEMSGILPTLKESVTALRHIEGSYRSATELSERLQSVIIELKDIEATVADDLERIDSNPERLDFVNQRLDTLYTLCRKHRVEGVESLIALRDQYTAQLEAIEHSDEHLHALRTEVAKAERISAEAAERLHKRRAEAAKPFAAEVVDILRRVGMADARFEITLTPTVLTPSGGDEVAYLFSANSGSAPRPIEKIASGGELSRVMLTLKSILARRLLLPTIIFDEIDTGVSGRVANAVGEIIATLSTTMQVIDITHLPQVASKGNRHLLVYKEGGVTNMRTLSAEERVEEIAKMLSGDRVTEAALEQARHLLAQ
ncbi:MAG: DNA repair protein RecN [Alistipes sp.]|nr:DNA repair protein RecN [Alistipes sp.]